MRPAWIDDLVRQARDAGVKVYFKSNLFDGNARILELPFYTPIEPDPAAAPAVFIKRSPRDDRGHRRHRPQIGLGTE
jgi:hypothetical protein